MTDQELFDKVATHLLAQNKKCTANNGKCVYVNDDGLKCAAGVLIKDYHPTMEDAPIKSLGPKVFGIETSQISLLRQLQIIHDQAEPEEWPRKLKETAHQFFLNGRIKKSE